MKKGGKRRLEGSSDLGGQIRKSRAERNLSQFDLAKLVGVSPTHISAIETGKVTNPGIELVERIAQVLGIGLLLGSSPERGSSPATLAYQSPFVLDSSPAGSIEASVQEIRELLADPRLPLDERKALADRLVDYARWQSHALKGDEDAARAG